MRNGQESRQEQDRKGQNKGEEKSGTGRKMCMIKEAWVLRGTGF